MAFNYSSWLSQHRMPSVRFSNAVQAAFDRAGLGLVFQGHCMLAEGSCSPGALSCPAAQTSRCPRTQTSSSLLLLVSMLAPNTFFSLNSLSAQWTASSSIFMNVHLWMWGAGEGAFFCFYRLGCWCFCILVLSIWMSACKWTDLKCLASPTIPPQENFIILCFPLLLYCLRQVCPPFNHNLYCSCSPPSTQFISYSVNTQRIICSIVFLSYVWFFACVSIVQ